MKILLSFLLCPSVFAQVLSNPEIFLFDLEINENSIQLNNGRNISQNPGYDNQPAFYNDFIVIYSKSRNNQTDIAAHTISTSKERWMSNTSFGGEYSPQRIPGTNNLAAVRLDTTGLQRLYSYDWDTGTPTLLLPDLKVGYFAFQQKDRLIASVLKDSAMDLYLIDLNPKLAVHKITGQSGRSLHKIPGTENMSYSAYNAAKDTYEIYFLDFSKQPPAGQFLSELPKNSQDYVWLDANRFLVGKDSEIYLYTIKDARNGILVKDLTPYNLSNISRMAINKSKTQLAIAAELPALTPAN